VISIGLPIRCSSLQIAATHRENRTQADSGIAPPRVNDFHGWYYVLLCASRRIGLAHTQFAEAACGTIRLKLLKLRALIRISVRRIKIAMASACSWQDEFELAHARLRNAIG
jgi:hypothetical protein